MVISKVTYGVEKVVYAANNMYGRCIFLFSCIHSGKHIKEEFATCKQGCRYHTDSVYKEN
jgi:hypothetical protein